MPYFENLGQASALPGYAVWPLSRACSQVG